MTLARRFYLVVNEMKVTRLRMEESKVLWFLCCSPQMVWACGCTCVGGCEVCDGIVLSGGYFKSNAPPDGGK